MPNSGRSRQQDFWAGASWAGRHGQGLVGGAVIGGSVWGRFCAVPGSHLALSGCVMCRKPSLRATGSRGRAPRWLAMTNIRNDEQIRLHILAARFGASHDGNLGALRPEGAGNAGCPMHPQPRVRFGSQVCTRVFTAEAPGSSGIPHAMVLRIIRALPGDRAVLPPSPAESLPPT
jgi:hypothetical protein